MITREELLKRLDREFLNCPDLGMYMKKLQEVAAHIAADDNDIDDRERMVYVRVLLRLARSFEKVQQWLLDLEEET